MLPKEELLHHIWKYKLFDPEQLRTADGHAVEVIRPGISNRNAGPDFSASRLRIGDVEWAGNVEIHVRASDWLKHGHQTDDNYSNIILHVVYENDLEEPLGSFPTVELKHLISDQVLKRYEALAGSTEQLACGGRFAEVPELVRLAWLDSLLIQRLQRKSEWINELIDTCHGDLEQVFQIALFRAFGMKVNALGFERLAQAIPWKTLGKHKDNLFQLEAILFGNAGFLKSPEDAYQKKLAKEFDFLSNKYAMEGSDFGVWKFSRMHLPNFPTVRIGQLAALYHHVGPTFGWFSNKNIDELERSLSIAPSEYWQTHYRFGKELPARGNRIGKTMVRHILINVVAPFLIVAADKELRSELKERALSILESLKPEQNNKTRAFEKAGFKAKSAAESQALIELETNYCKSKNCLNCSIGVHLLKH